MKVTTMKALRGLALAAILLPAGACANAYSGVHPGYYVSGNQPLTAEYIGYQDNVVGPRCQQYAEETNPTRNQLGTAWGWNNIGGGLVGGGAGNAASTTIVGGTVTAANVAGGAVYYAAAAGAMGYAAGVNASDQQVHSWEKWCRAADAGGYHAVPPSVGQQILESGQPQSFSSPFDPATGNDRPPNPPH